MYSARLILRTRKNGIRKKISNQKYGTATMADCHALADSRNPLILYSKPVLPRYQQNIIRDALISLAILDSKEPS